VNSELLLVDSTLFDLQNKGDPANLPPINEHVILSCLIGAIPSMKPLTGGLTLKGHHKCVAS
jgi:hypothetical protein